MEEESDLVAPNEDPDKLQSKFFVWVQTPDYFISSKLKCEGSFSMSSA